MAPSVAVRGSFVLESDKYLSIRCKREYNAAMEVFAMECIQLITFTGLNVVENKKDTNIIISTLKRPKSFDMFDINIIDLNDDHLWEYDAPNTNSINKIKDFISIKNIIDNCKKAKIVILLPQNKNFKYYEAGRGSYHYKIELKDMLDNLKEIISNVYNINKINLRYEPIEVSFENEKIYGEFCFSDIISCEKFGEILLRSDKSDKPVAISIDRVVLTTLHLDNVRKITKFLKKINLLSEESELPEWFKEIQMFDDNKQHNVIDEANAIINEQNKIIDEARKVLEKNNSYKSILYTNGDELVKTVFEILYEMIGCNLSEFEDIKNEDYAFSIDGLTFIGEIKGISSNIKGQNLSQLENHFMSFMDRHPEVESDKIKRALIINHQRLKALSERDPIDEKQIEQAKRYGSLIIETYTLLRMFEKFKNGELSREECIDKLANNTGLLEI